MGPPVERWRSVEIHFCGWMKTLVYGCLL
jgi:hypothetical protein